MAKPITITNENFQAEVLSSDIPVLVDFWAEWCGPCKMIAPSVEELAEEYEGKIKIGKLDIDSNQNVASEYGIRSIPSLLIFRNGQVVDQIVGAVPKNHIQSKIDAVL